MHLSCNDFTTSTHSVLPFVDALSFVKAHLFLYITFCSVYWTRLYTLTVTQFILKWCVCTFLISWSRSHSSCHLFRSVCPFLFWYCDSYQPKAILPAPSHHIFLPLFFLHTHCESFRGGVSWFGMGFISAHSRSLSAPITFCLCLSLSCCSSAPTAQHVMLNRAPREFSLGHCVGLCLYSVTFLPI